MTTNTAAWRLISLFAARVEVSLRRRGSPRLPDLDPRAQLDDRIALPVYPGVSVDHRHVIYLGVRTNLAEQRLIDDLRHLGSYFVLKPEVLDELPRYGFEPAAQPVIEALKLGTSLPELEASHRELDPRFAQAIIYALVSCTACVIPRFVTPG